MERNSTRRLILLLASVLLAIGSSSGLVAMCVEPPENGGWEHSGGTTALSGIKLRFVCQDMMFNGKPHPPGPPWYIKAGDWGEAGARKLASGHIYAVFDRGSAKHHVYAKMSAFRPGQLWVWTWTDFADPAKEDSGTHSWFRKKG